MASNQISTTQAHPSNITTKKGPPSPLQHYIAASLGFNINDYVTNVPMVTGAIKVNATYPLIAGSLIPKPTVARGNNPGLNITTKTLPKPIDGFKSTFDANGKETMELISPNLDDSVNLKLPSVYRKPSSQRPNLRKFFPSSTGPKPASYFRAPHPKTPQNKHLFFTEPETKTGGLLNLETGQFQDYEAKLPVEVSFKAVDWNPKPKKVAGEEWSKQDSELFGAPDATASLPYSEFSHEIFGPSLPVLEPVSPRTTTPVAPKLAVLAPKEVNPAPATTNPRLKTLKSSAPSSPATSATAGAPGKVSAPSHPSTVPASAVPGPSKLPPAASARTSHDTSSPLHLGSPDRIEDYSTHESRQARDDRVFGKAEKAAEKMQAELGLGFFDGAGDEKEKKRKRVAVPTPLERYLGHAVKRVRVE